MKRTSEILGYVTEMFSCLYSVNRKTLKYEEQYIEELNKAVILLNIKRIIQLCFFVGILQVFFVILGKYSSYYEAIGNLKLLNFGLAIFNIVTCIIYSIAALELYKKQINFKAMKKLYISYYFLICIILFLYFYTDIQNGRTSFYIIFITMIFTAFPIFTNSETFFFISINTTGIIGFFIFININLIFKNFYSLLILIIGWIIMIQRRNDNVNGLYNQIKLTFLNKNLENLSMNDHLTGLPNRRFLDEYVKSNLPKWILNNNKVMVLMIDIDNFKNYNDTYSHLDGDDCLSAVASTMKKSFLKFTNIDYIIARIGGEEFLALIDGWKTKDEIKKISSQIRQSVEDMHLIAGSGSLYEYVTISIGGCIFDPSDADKPNSTPIEAYYRIADFELYNAKKGGKNSISIEGELIK